MERCRGPWISALSCLFLPRATVSLTVGKTAVVDEAPPVRLFDAGVDVSYDADTEAQFGADAQLDAEAYAQADLCWRGEADCTDAAVSTITLDTGKAQLQCVAEECEGKKFVFVTHHKTGTELGLWLAQGLAEAIFYENRTVIGWGYGGTEEDLPRRHGYIYEQKLNGTRRLPYSVTKDYAFNEEWNEAAGVGCGKSHVTVYAVGIQPQVEKILRECPQTKIVHMTRDPLDVVISGYRYTKKNPFHGGDSLPGSNEKLYRRLSNRDGLAKEAQLAARYTLDPMLDVLTMEDDRILHVSQEDFDKDYDDTTRRVYIHFLGDGHERVKDLVEYAKLADVSRMQASGTMVNLHVNDNILEKQTLEHAYEAMLREGEPNITYVDNLRQRYSAMYDILRSGDNATRSLANSAPLAVETAVAPAAAPLKPKVPTIPVDPAPPAARARAPAAPSDSEMPVAKHAALVVPGDPELPSQHSAAVSRPNVPADPEPPNAPR